MPPIETRESDAGWMVVLAAFFGVMAGFGSLVVFTFSVFLKPLSAEFGWSREAVSSAFGFAALSVAVASPKLGQLLYRYGARRVILPCNAIYGIALLSLAFLTSHILQFYAIFVIIGLAGNGTTQMGYSRAVSNWFDSRRGVALALVMSGTGAGSIVLPVVAQWLVETGGWITAYLSLGGLSLFCGIPLDFVCRKTSALELRNVAFQQTLGSCHQANGLQSCALLLELCDMFLKKGGLLSKTDESTH